MSFDVHTQEIDLLTFIDNLDLILKLSELVLNLKVVMQTLRANSNTNVGCVSLCGLQV